MNVVWIALLQLLSAGLLAAEIFLPSFGLLAMAMVACLSASLWLTPAGVWFWSLVALDAVAFPILFKLLLGQIHRTPMGLPQCLDAGGGEEELSRLLGASGRAETDLRPAGKALVAGELRDVVSDGQFLSKGDRLLVVGTGQNRLLVRAARSDEDLSAQGD